MTDAAGAVEAGDAASFEGLRDKSLYWTLSLYVDEKRVRDALGRHAGADALRNFQERYHGSRKLHDAMEPLFNDIADRERLGQVEDFLLDTPGAREGETIAIEAPDTIVWTTEGVTYAATPGDLGRPRALKLRRFWYAHVNGALSYHLAFRYNYEHTPADFYFMSLLHKVCAPKEFAQEDRRVAKTLRVHRDEVGVLPLDAMRVQASGGVAAPFWRFVAGRFDADAKDLFDALAKTGGASGYDVGKVSFGQLISVAPFLEVPHLQMPRARFMFFFQDKQFFERLLPPTDPATGRRPSRHVMVQEHCYEPYVAEIKRLMDRAAERDAAAVELDADYWHWVTARPDLGALPDEEIARKRRTIPAFERGRADCLQYLFLSGFNQNIIDFMNQDASEVLDSIDPIYPTTAEQAEENFFVRFANPRALITYVRTSRSLDTGNDYIGTCPYAFLIHALALHNEFMARDYEMTTYALVDEVKRLNDARNLADAAEAFYKFRTTDYTDYKKFKYENVFRYDTERDVFASVEARRGTARKEAYLDSVVANMEHQTRDLEARLTKNDENRMNRLLGLLGVFGLFQLCFNWLDAFKKLADAKMAYMDLMPPFLHLNWDMVQDSHDKAAVATMYLSMGFAAALLLGFGLYLLWRRKS